MERHQEAMALTERSSDCVNSISIKLASVPGDVPEAAQEHLNPKCLASCALERSFESFMLSKSIKIFAESHLAESLHKL